MNAAKLCHRLGFSTPIPTSAATVIRFVVVSFDKPRSVSCNLDDTPINVQNMNAYLSLMVQKPKACRQQT